MTTRPFRPDDPDELWLLPPSPRDWLPEDHLAFFLADLVEELNLQPILSTSGGVMRGTAPYHPQLLVKVLLYAYAVGIPASRQTSGPISGPSVSFGSSICRHWPICLGKSCDSASGRGW